MRTVKSFNKDSTSAMSATFESGCNGKREESELCVIVLCMCVCVCMCMHMHVQKVNKCMPTYYNLRLGKCLQGRQLRRQCNKRPREQPRSQTCSANFESTSTLQKQRVSAGATTHVNSKNKQIYHQYQSNTYIRITSKI